MLGVFSTEDKSCFSSTLMMAEPWICTKIPKRLQENIATKFPFYFHLSTIFPLPNVDPNYCKRIKFFISLTSIPFFFFFFFFFFFLFFYFLFFFFLFFLFFFLFLFLLLFFFFFCFNSSTGLYRRSVVL